MQFRALDINGDWTFGSGRNNYLQEVEALKANIKTRVKSWVGDCFFDLKAGIDWKNRLGQFNQRAQLEQDLKLIILQTPGVLRINDFSTSVDTLTRAFSSSYNIDTQFGTNITGIIEG